MVLPMWQIEICIPDANMVNSVKWIWAYLRAASRLPFCSAIKNCNLCRLNLRCAVRALDLNFCAPTQLKYLSIKSINTNFAHNYLRAESILCDCRSWVISNSALKLSSSCRSLGSCASCRNVFAMSNILSLTKWCAIAWSIYGFLALKASLVASAAVAMSAFHIFSLSIWTLE